MQAQNIDAYHQINFSKPRLLFWTLTITPPKPMMAKVKPMEYMKHSRHNCFLFKRRIKICCFRRLKLLAIIIVEPSWCRRLRFSSMMGWMVTEIGLSLKVNFWRNERRWRSFILSTDHRLNIMARSAKIWIYSHRNLILQYRSFLRGFLRPKC